MKRWVNDYNIAETCFKGYRPVLPFETRGPGRDGVTSILMEKPDADYKADQETKMMYNDMRSPTGGKDLERYIAQETEARINDLIGQMTWWDSLKLLFCKTFRYRLEWMEAPYRYAEKNIPTFDKSEKWVGECPK